MSESASWAIDQAVEEAEREWRRLHIEQPDLTRLSHDLRLDLEAAAADGINPAGLIGADVPGFARRLADEAGARRIPYGYRSLLQAGLLGALPGLVVAYAIFSGGIGFSPLTSVPQRVLVSVYAVIAALVFAIPLFTIWFRLRGLPAIGRTVLAMALLLPLAGVVITPLAMGFAALVNYSNALPVLVIEAGMVAGALAGATVLSRRWALRSWACDPEPPPVAPIAHA